jgi:hypothetical protein
MGDDAALVFYFVVLWGAIFGIAAPASSRSIVCRRSKQLAAVTFVCLVFEIAQQSLNG